MKDYYCKHRPQNTAGRDQRLPARCSPTSSASRATLLPRRRRGQLRDRPGRHDRHAAPARPRVRRARPTAARSTSRGSARRSSAPTARCSSGSRPKVQGHVRGAAARRCGYIDQRAAWARAKVGTMAWQMIGFPLDQVHIRSKTGSAEVYGKQSTSWVASYDQELRRGDDGQPGRHRLGHLRARRSARSGRRSTASTATTGATRARPRSPAPSPPDGPADVRRRRLDPAARRPR